MIVNNARNRHHSPTLIITQYTVVIICKFFLLHILGNFREESEDRISSSTCDNARMFAILTYNSNYNSDYSQRHMHSLLLVTKYKNDK